MKIKKISEELVYKKEASIMKFDVNGKAVHVRSWLIDDQELSNYENDYEIDEQDLEDLTDEEHELFGQELHDLMDLEEGEETEVTL